MRSCNKTKVLYYYLPIIPSIPVPTPAPNTHTHTYAHTITHTHAEPSSSRQNAHYTRPCDPNQKKHWHSPCTYPLVHSHTCRCLHMHSLHTHTHTHTHGYKTGSTWYVQINQKVWRKRCIFCLALKVWREGEALRLAGSKFQTEQCIQKEHPPKVFKFVFGIFSSRSVKERMGARCREKKTGMVEECHQSDRSEHCELVLNVVFYWEPMGFFQKWCDMTKLWFFQAEPRIIFLDLLYVCEMFIGYTCKSSIAVVQSWHDHGYNKLCCGTVSQEQIDRRDSPEYKKCSVAEATDVLFHWECLVKMHSKVQVCRWSEKECYFYLYLQTYSRPNVAHVLHCWVVVLRRGKNTSLKTLS